MRNIVSELRSLSADVATLSHNNSSGNNEVTVSLIAKAK
jgi:hypothetical protein